MTDDRAGIIRLAEGVMGWATKDGFTGPGTDGMVKILAERDKWACQLMWWPGCYEDHSRTWNPFQFHADAFALEAAIPEAKRREYVDALLASLYDPSLFVMIHATPRQRSEAALAVLTEDM